ncbi:M1 family metallopeptidase [Aliifodinibius sp. S!AR15-10]|uniref:M1 family metallopeptidase n=1 Tax=Aliifodinibius sp. S!AR15-10 TaxID=2950437 RepID=UPI00285A6B65|nr:M1 family metallopeptidase [Aliifodinibius sp. S!AR15-10]MDR8391334.1 M1 family metallopeptidase [Aliifodinibius sp. S!AR15-10]
MKVRFGLLLLLLSFLVLTAQSQTRDYWQQRVEYEMDIRMDAPNNQFSGTQKLTYHNNSPDTLHRVFYHLYFNAFQPGSMMDKRSRTIEDPDSRVRDRIQHLTEDQIGYHHIQSLMQDGDAVDYKVDETIVEVTLNDPIEPGESTVFEMEFDSQVPLQIRRSGWNNNEGVEFSMTQWYPKISEYDHEGWHPNPYVGREFHGVFGSFNIKITIDSSYVIGSTGYLQNPQEIGHGYQEQGTEADRPDSDKLTWHWKAENVHDFAWGADPDFTHTTAQVPSGPKLHFFYQTDPVATNSATSSDRQDSLKAYWERLPEYTVKGFQFMSEHLGKYPYEKFSVIQGGDGGMEYPMATLITGNRSLRSLVGVTVHEFIHMWYYAVLATNESRYPWMDEGFTTYASALTMEHLFGERDFPHSGSYGSYYRIVEDGDEEAMDTHADHFTTNRAYGVASYSKGAVFLNQMRYVIGPEVFDRGMKRYFREWKFKHPTGRDFLRVMEKESDMVLDWYYEYFIETTKTIDYGIESVVGQNDSTFVTLKREDLMPMPIDLVVEYTDGSSEQFYLPLQIMRGEKANEYPDMPRTTLTDWPWTYPTYTLGIPEPAETISRIVIDPTGRMADINRENNAFDMEEATTVFGTK